MITAFKNYVQREHAGSVFIYIVDVAPGIKVFRNLGKVRVRAASQGVFERI